MQVSKNYIIGSAQDFCYIVLKRIIASIWISHYFVNSYFACPIIFGRISAMNANGTSPSGSVPPEFDFMLYRYTPSLAGAVVAAVIFGILTITHFWRMARAKSFYFTPFLIGGICKSCLRYISSILQNKSFDRMQILTLSSTVQTVGYCGRMWSHFDKESIGGFVMQAILILVAPALYAASIYMILGRLILAVDAEKHSLIPVKWLTKAFVTGDIISFTLQAAGGGVQAAGTLEMYNIGEKMIIAGLWVQIVVFGFFVSVSALFNTRLARCRTVAAERRVIPWKRHLLILYLTSGLILVRSIFRVIEYLQGNGGYLISHEIFLYMFDALLMALVMALFAVWYVGDLAPAAAYDKQDSIISGSADGMLDATRLQHL